MIGAIIWRVEGRYLSRWVLSDQLLGAIIWRVEGRYLSRWVISTVLLGAKIWRVEGRYISRLVISAEWLGAIIWRGEGNYLPGCVISITVWITDKYSLMFIPYIPCSISWYFRNISTVIAHILLFLLKGQGSDEDLVSPWYAGDGKAPSPASL